MFRLPLAALVAAGLLLAIAVTAEATPNVNNLPPGSGMLDQPPVKVAKMLPPRAGLRPVPIRLPAGALQPAAPGVITKPLPKAKVRPFGPQPPAVTPIPIPGPKLRIIGRPRPAATPIQLP